MEANVATITCEEAAKRHQGVTPLKIARMCLKGQRLVKRYQAVSKVPEKEKGNAIFAKKVGKSWAVPVAELDRVFLP